MSAFGKDWRPSRSEQVDAQFAARVDELRSTLRFQDPGLIAARSAVPYLTLGPNRGELHIPFWENVCILSFPELIGYNDQDEQLPDFLQALLLYYLITADGAPLANKWVSFADLPDGLMYNTAFQGYSGDEIVKAFRKEITERWNLAAIDGDVRASQRRRRVVDEALNSGKATAWDFQPFKDASKQYMRNSIDLDDLEAMVR